MRSILAGALALFAASQALAAGPTNPIQIGLWQGGAYTDDQTGRFSHCAVITAYKSGTAMIVFGLRDYSWGLGFANPSWSLQPGTQIPISLTFDNGNPIAVVGTVIPGKPPTVRVPMPGNSQVLNSFRSAVLMTAIAQGQHFGFRLDGTSRVMPALGDCVRTALAAESGGAQKQASDTTVEEMRLATNFLLAARLPNAQVVDRAAVPGSLVGWTAWKSDEETGAVKIIHGKPSQTGLELASELIASDGQACKGKFASARSSELVDNDVVVRAMVSCSDSKGDISLQYFVAPFHKTDFAVFAVLGLQSTRPADTQARLPEIFMKAALGASR